MGSIKLNNLETPRAAATAAAAAASWEVQCESVPPVAVIPRDHKLPMQVAPFGNPPPKNPYMSLNYHASANIETQQHPSWNLTPPYDEPRPCASRHPRKAGRDASTASSTRLGDRSRGSSLSLLSRTSSRHVLPRRICNKMLIISPPALVAAHGGWL